MSRFFSHTQNGNLPPGICFRITRRCNAHCDFCLAPDQAPAEDPAFEQLAERLDWLAGRGVTRVMFCGGEPTLHPALPALLKRSRACKATPAVTTNGLALSDELLAALHSTGTRVKLSLHGDREHHDRLVGQDAFARSTANLQRLLESGVAVTVQTTAVANGLAAIPWMIDYCLAAGIRRLSILPFLPRGRGWHTRRQYALSAQQRRSLRGEITNRRRALNGRLDLRWLDFSTRPIPVLDTDGRVILEGATVAMDRVLDRSP